MITQLSLEGFSCVVNRLQFAAEVLWLWYDLAFKLIPGILPSNICCNLGITFDPEKCCQERILQFPF